MCQPKVVFQKLSFAYLTKKHKLTPEAQKSFALIPLKWSSTYISRKQYTVHCTFLNSFHHQFRNGCSEIMAQFNADTTTTSAIIIVQTTSYNKQKYVNFEYGIIA